MPKGIYIKDDGEWKLATNAFVKADGTWENTTPHIKVPTITGKSLIKCGYGYNWYAVNEPKLLPIGYSILDLAHVQHIHANLGGNTNSMKFRRMDGHPIPEFDTNIFPRWDYSETLIPTDSLKFSAIPCGYRATRWYNDGSSYNRHLFYGTNKYGSTGSITNIPVIMPTSAGISTQSIDTTSDTINNKNRMIPIRFWRNCYPFESSEENGTIIDRVNDIDGNIYDMIKLGTLVVSRQNYACTKLNDGTPIDIYTGFTTVPTNNTLKCSPVEDYNNLGVSQAFFSNESESWWEEPSNSSGWKACNTEVSIGSFYKGGIVFYKDINRILIVREELIGVDGLAWGVNNDILGCSDNIGEGYNNTQLMITANSPMTNIVDDINITGSMGYSDWFIPSINEAIEITKTFPYSLKALSYINNSLQFNSSPSYISRLISSSENSSFYKYSSVITASPYYGISTIGKTTTIHNYDLIALIRQILL